MQIHQTQRKITSQIFINSQINITVKMFQMIFIQTNEAAILTLGNKLESLEPTLVRNYNPLYLINN